MDTYTVLSCAVHLEPIPDLSHAADPRSRVSSLVWGPRLSLCMSAECSGVSGSYRYST